MCGCGQKAPIATHTINRKQQIKGQPLRFIQYHAVRARSSRSPVERFWEKVDKRGPDECWNWLGARAYGYGRLVIGSRKDETRHVIIASRFSYELVYGPIPESMFICHTCDNRSCVNPTHLFLGTHQDNMTDMYNKSRSTKGEKNGQAKLTHDEVRQIRQRYASGETQRAISRLYAIGQSTVQAIVSRKIWNHVE